METKKVDNKTLHEQLVYIQKELKAPKSNKNTFGNYNYRSCEDILEAVKPLLGNCILSLSDEIKLIGDRYYVEATASLRYNGDLYFTRAYARESLEKKGMDSAQVTGAASSYARKYALNGLFAIDDTKDADTMDNTTKTATTPVKSPDDDTTYDPTETWGIPSTHKEGTDLGNCIKCGAPNALSKTGNAYCTAKCWLK